MGIETRSNAPNDTIRIPHRPRQYQKRKTNKTIYQTLLTKKKQIQLKRRCFWAKQTDKEIPGDKWEKILELEKECTFPEFSTELPISQTITSITDRKLQDKQMKEKDLDVPKVVEQIQQNTYDRKNKKNTIREVLLSNRETDFKEEPIHKIAYTGQYGTRSKERHKDVNCRYCDAPNWNPNHKCPAHVGICHKCEKKTTSRRHADLNDKKNKNLKNWRKL